MSKNHTTIIQRYPDKTVPEEFLRAVIKARPSGGGYAVQAKDKGKPVLVIDRMDTPAVIDEVQQFLNTPDYKDSHVLLAFHQFEKSSEADLQPFSFPVDGAEDLAIGIEGDFPTMASGEVHPETQLSLSVIMPNLVKLRRLTAGDVEAFMKELNDPTFQDMLMSRIGGRGYLCFLPATGEPMWVTKDKLGSNFPWGKVSNAHGYVEAAPVVDTEKKKGWFSRNATGPSVPVAGAQPVQQPAPPAPQPEVPLNNPTPGPQPDTRVDPPETSPNPMEGKEVDLGNGTKGVWRKVKPMSKNDRKAFIRRVTGNKDLPENWQDPNFLFLEVQYQSAPRTLPELKEKLEQQQRPQAEAGTKLATAPTRGSEVVHEANTMMLTAEEMSVAETELVKMLDRQGKDIPNPLDIQKAETKYPSFTGKFGIKLDQVDKWLPGELAEFAKDNGKAFFHLFLEVRRAKIAAEEVLAAMSAKHAGPAPTPAPEQKVAAAGGAKGWGSWGKK